MDIETSHIVKNLVPNEPVVITKVQRLTTDRGALLVPGSKQINKMEDFELITWLVVR
jgi:hypothetical protein